MRPNRSFGRVSRVIGAIVMMAAALLVTTGTRASAVTYDGWFTFDKNWSDPSNSRLYWDVYRTDLDPPRRIISKSWRAGSGLGSTNSCLQNNGWLPNGYYSVKQWNNYPGTTIKGYAFQLSNKNCPNGTPRTALFMHTETGSNNVQCADAPGDQACRWEFPTYNEYHSLGCIKLSPTDIKDARDSFLQFYVNGVDYPNMLQVVD
jgi:hypothetical protein